MRLLKSDLEAVLRRVPGEVLNLMKTEGIVLAGGFIRAVVAHETPSDIDLFGKNKEQLRRCAEVVEKALNGRIHETDNALTVIPSSYSRLPVVQFITRWTFDDPSKILASFDFTTAQAGIWWGSNMLPLETAEWRSECSDRFYPDLASKRLWYTSPIREEEAGGSMMRVRKFLGKGYHIEAESLGKVIARIANKAKGDMPTETVIIGLLREVDPLIILNGVPSTEEE